MSLVSFYTPWKHQKTSGFLMFSGGIEKEHWHEMSSWSILGSYHLTKLAGTCSEPCQTSKIDHFVNIGNVFQLLTIFARSSILDVWQCSEYASEWYFIVTAWKVSVFEVFQPECGKIQTRKTPNTDTFHAVWVILEWNMVRAIFLRILVRKHRVFARGLLWLFW